MRIAVFTDTYLPTVDGVVNAIRFSKAGLEARGHRVLVVAPQNGHDDGVDVLRCRAREFKRYPGYFMAFLPSRRELDALEEFQPDLIHSHGLAFMGLKGMWAARELALPMVLTFHTMILDAVPHYVSLRRSYLLRRLISLYLRGFLHRCGAVLTPTRSTLEEIHDLAPRMRKTAVVPNGVDVDRFRPDVDGTAVRLAYGAGEGPLLLHVGRVAPEKDISFLLHAFPRILDQRPEATFLVVGTGPDLPRCRRWVEGRGLRDRVRFTGFVPDADLPAHYAAADALTVASRFETQGLVALEAMACGTPPVAVAYRAFPEYIQDGVNGFLFSPGDREGYIRAVDRALGCEGAVRQCARATAEAFSWNRTTDLLEGVYREMVNGLSPGSEEGSTGR